MPKLYKIDRETSDALDGSIQKWENIVNAVAEDGGWRDCPLCLKFNCQSEFSINYENFSQACEGCPIYIHTEMEGCEGTPHNDREVAIDIGAEQEEIDDFSQKMLDFLINLKSLCEVVESKEQP